jgi:hypothetical protein
MPQTTTLTQSVNAAHRVVVLLDGLLCSGLVWDGNKETERERERASIGVTTHAHAQTIKSFYLETLKLISSLLCVQYQNNCFGTFVCSRYTNRRVQKIR